jgi:hypothetical protein
MFKKIMPLLIASVVVLIHVGAAKAQYGNHARLFQSS